MSQSDRPDKDEAFEEFVRRDRGRLLVAATLLTAGDRDRAEDLVQSTLVRLYLSWRRTARRDTYAYARRTLINVFLDQRRRPSSRREYTVALVPEVAGADDIIAWT